MCAGLGCVGESQGLRAGRDPRTPRVRARAFPHLAPPRCARNSTCEPTGESSDGVLFASDQVQSHSASPMAYGRHGRGFCTPGRRESPLPSQVRGALPPLGSTADPVPAGQCPASSGSDRGARPARNSAEPFVGSARRRVGSPGLDRISESLASWVRLAGWAGGTDGLEDVAVPFFQLGPGVLLFTPAHAFVPRDEVDEDAEEGEGDREDQPSGLGPSTHVVVADQLTPLVAKTGLDLQPP